MLTFSMSIRIQIEIASKENRESEKYRKHQHSTAHTKRKKNEKNLVKTSSNILALCKLLAMTFNGLKNVSNKTIMNLQVMHRIRVRNG